MSAAPVDGVIRDKLIALGWTPPSELGHNIGELVELAKQIDADPNLHHPLTIGQMVGTLIDEGRLAYVRLHPNDFELLVKLYATQEPPHGEPDG